MRLSSGTNDLSFILLFSIGLYYFVYTVYEVVYVRLVRGEQNISN